MDAGGRCGEVDLEVEGVCVGGGGVGGRLLGHRRLLCESMTLRQNWAGWMD